MRPRRKNRGTCRHAPVLSWWLGPHVDSKQWQASNNADSVDWKVFWRTCIGWCGAPTDPMWCPWTIARNSRCASLGLAECAA